MTKDVLIAIKGLQFGEDPNNEEDGTEELESIVSGNYYFRNGSHYILYEEVTEGFTEITRNMIKCKEHSMTLTKKGLVNVQMIFEEKQKNMSSYMTPYGDIIIGIDTKAVEVKEEENEIHIQVDYALEANYQFLADCKINVLVRSKDQGGSLVSAEDTK